LAEDPEVSERTAVIVTFLTDERKPSKRRTKTSLREHRAFGIWDGRPEVSDSLAFARSLREAAEERAHAR